MQEKIQSCSVTTPTDSNVFSARHTHQTQSSSTNNICSEGLSEEILDPPHFKKKLFEKFRDNSKRTIKNY